MPVTVEALITPPESLPCDFCGKVCPIEDLYFVFKPAGREVDDPLNLYAFCVDVYQFRGPRLQSRCPSVYVLPESRTRDQSDG